MKLIDCHDCGSPVSLSARWCPQCGSKDIAGPVRTGKRVSRTVGVEARNDQTMMWMIVVLGTIGAFYGMETGSSWIREVVGGVFYGFIGAAVAVPMAFAVN